MCAVREHEGWETVPLFFYLLTACGVGDPPLRPSNEHILIVRVAGATRVGHAITPFLIPS